MSKSYAAGLAVGIIFAVVVLTIRTMLVKKYRTKETEFDERQILVRQEAYKSGFFATTLSLVIVAMLQLFEISWCEAPLDIFLCCFIGVGVFAVKAILNDAYFTTPRQQRSVFILFAAVIVSQLANFISHLGDLTENGVLSMNALSGACGLLFVILLITALIHNSHSKSETEDEE